MYRTRVTLVLLAASALLLTCAPMKNLAPGPCAAGPGVGHPDRPIVCVDDSSPGLSVYPDPVVVHEVMSTDKSTPPVINWFTKSGAGDLHVRFKDERCVRNIRCNGGHCMATVTQITSGEETRCKYDVLLTGHPTLDPEAVIVRCCTSG